MKKYLVLYTPSVPATEQLANNNPEMARKGMELWMGWMKKAGSALIDGGSPLNGTNKKIGGYSIIQAESQQHLDALMKDHPHFHAPGAAIETYEMLKLPGM
jgi:hypothetical protein